MLKDYLDMADYIARTGTLKRGSIHGRIGLMVFEKQIDDFLYVTDPQSKSVQVQCLVNYDPFISRWDDGEPCRRHLGRYNSIDLIKKHYEDLKGKENATTNKDTTRFENSNYIE